ncbi:MAG TPA: cellulose-binding protein, partial [Trebonia sp.]|nr:cellulose-binding protein [Trebonia sp.]
AAQREHDEIVQTARRKAEEIRVREQRLLEESEALRSQSEADLEIELAARREEAERGESERHTAAVAETRALVAEAERRAAAAQEQAGAVTAQNEQAKRDADERVRQLLEDAKRDADQVLADATAAATRLRTEADADAERRRATAQRDLNELSKQKDEVARHLAQMRQLVGSLLPDGLD